MRHSFADILRLFLIWRTFTFIIGFYGLLILSPQHLNQAFSAWTNWDGQHYLSISTNGYVYNIQLAFLPLYPISIKIFSMLTFGNNVIASLLVSNLSCLLFLVILYRYCYQKYGPNPAWRTLIIYLFFPTSFFLGAAYSESLYLLLTISAIYLASRTIKSKRLWTEAWILAMLASLTRVIGFLVGIVVVSRYFQVKKSLKVLLLILLSFSGLGLYMLYLQLNYGNPIIFGEVQSYWNRQLALTNPIQTLAFYHQHLFQLPIDYKYLTDYLFTVAFLILSALVYRQLDKLLGLYSLGVIIIPLLSGTLDSMSRFALSAFPVFILLSLYTRRKPLLLYLLALFIPLLIVYTILFVNHYWVA